jgi:mono/diheme cytochrome c family protein
MTVNRLPAAVFAALLAAALATGCSKSTDQSTSQGSSPDAAASGPVTDADSTGLKPSAGPVGVGDAEHGKAIFAQNCSTCHGAAGAGGAGALGPRLKNEKTRKDYDAAIVWIKDPQPPMPKLYPQVLSEKDVEDVAAYVETL